MQESVCSRLLTVLLCLDGGCGLLTRLEVYLGGTPGLGCATDVDLIRQHRRGLYAVRGRPQGWSDLPRSELHLTVGLPKEFKRHTILHFPPRNFHCDAA